MRRRRFLAQAGAMVGTRALARVIQFPPVSAASAAIRLNAQSPAASGSELERLLSLFDFENEAHTRIPHGAWERISGGSADEITLRWNREAYEHIRLKPRILVDVSKLDTRVRLFGQELPFPILLAPTGGQRFIHPEGEVAAARGAAAANSIYVISSSASMKVEDIASSTKGPVWFQLYVQKDRAFTRDLVQRAEDSGCRALCVTVDSPTFGTRNREDRAKKELPERELPNLKGKDGKSSKAPETLPVIRPRHAQIPTKQNVGMVARLFVFNTKWIRIFFGHNATAKEFSALIQVEACEDHSLR